MRRNTQKPKADMCEYDVIVIGAGIIGTMIARELIKFKIRIALLDKECFPGFGITKSSLA